MQNHLNRREFLQLGAGALATAALNPLGVLGADAPKKRTIHKAIMYGTVGFPGSVLEKFRAVKAAGFEGVRDCA